jgi:hypothetical protein
VERELASGHLVLSSEPVTGGDSDFDVDGLVDNSIRRSIRR